MATEETIILIACAIYVAVVAYAFVKADVIKKKLTAIADKLL
jgi:hypothetical protein